MIQNKLSYNNEFTNDILYLILTYNDDYTVKKIKDRIIIYEPTYILVLNQLNKICSITDKCSVKSWRNFNHCCMKKLYRKCNFHDFHLLLNSLGTDKIITFIELETVNMLHYMSLSYYNVLKYIYDTNYPILLNDNKKIAYGLFWDYCKFYFIIYKGLQPNENLFLL